MITDFWLGGYDAKTDTYIAFCNPIESLKPKLLHVRMVDPKKPKDEPAAKYRRCKHCHKTAILSLDLCKDHYLIK